MKNCICVKPSAATEQDLVSTEKMETSPVQDMKAYREVEV